MYTQSNASSIESVRNSFSVRNTILQFDIKTESLNSRSIIKGHMSVPNIKPETFSIADQLVLSVKLSRLKFGQVK